MESFSYFTSNNNQKLCICKSKIKTIFKLNVCWKVTAETLERETKNILHLVFYFNLRKYIASGYYCL